jgi:hypothetical protein
LGCEWISCDAASIELVVSVLDGSIRVQITAVETPPWVINSSLNHCDRESRLTVQRSSTFNGASIVRNIKNYNLNNYFINMPD